MVEFLNISFPRRLPGYPIIHDAVTSFSIPKVAHPNGINLQLAAETCKFSQDPPLSMGVLGTLWYLTLTFINKYCRTGYLRCQISKLSAKYQFCAIHTADTRRKNHESGPFVHRIRESPSFIPARV